jgi:hypothetical protein
MPTFSGQISTSSDDAAQATNNSVSTNGATAIVSLLTNRNSWVGFRFQNVTIPSGATISAATISVWCESSSETAMDAILYGNKVPNPSTFSATTSYISGLAETTANVTWNATITNGQFNASPDISAIITELIGQGSWASGNAMLFVFHAQSSANEAGIEMYDGSPSEAAELSITYTTASTGPPNPINLYGGRIAGQEMLYGGPAKTITAYGFR